MDGGLRWLVFGCLVLGCGCTSLQWAEMAPDEIRQGIHEGHLLQVGDRVGVIDKAGTEQLIRVTAVKPEVIVGKLGWGDRRWGEEVEIAIDDIVAMRTARLDRGRTTAAAMTGAAFGSYLLLILLIAPLPIFL